MFNEENTVENYLRDRLTGVDRAQGAWGYSPGRQLARVEEDVLLVDDVRRSLLRLNPDVAAHPERVDEVLYKLQALLVASGGGGLVNANEEFRAWLIGDRTMPFGPGGEHVDIKFFNFDDPRDNTFVVAQQVVFRQAGVEVRFDLVLFVNGIPLVVVEAKTPVRKAVTWVDGAIQVHDDYERNVPRFFVPNAFSVATDGKELRFGAIRMPLLLWGPWRSDDPDLVKLSEVEQAAAQLLDPETVLDILRSFTVFATDKQHRKIKVIPRYQQYEAANRIVERVVAGYPRKGLIWHFQGSGKSLLMVFAAQKLRLHPALKNPTVLIVVDRVDLDTQISATFHTHDIPNLVGANNRKELATMLAQDVRKVVITTIHKFGEAKGVLNERDNIIVLVDEAHRTQEGDLGVAMREALPNAFLFGLTGTPINKRDRNTFWAFGADEDEKGYMSLYSFADSVKRRSDPAAAFRAAHDPATGGPGRHRSGVSRAHGTAHRRGPGHAREEGRESRRPCEGTRTRAKHLRGHRDALSGDRRAERLQGAGRRLRSRGLPALQGSTRRAPRSRSQCRGDERPEEGNGELAGALREVERPVHAVQGRGGEAARSLPRPGRSAQDPDRHRQAVDRLRRADPADHVPGPAHP